MNLCFVCNEYPPMPHGGIGPVTKQLAEGVVGLGHTAVVVGLYSQAVDMVEDDNSVQVHRLCKLGQGGFGELRSRWKLSRYVTKLHRRFGFDLVEAPEWRGDSALLNLDCPVVLRLHTSHVVDRMVTGSSKPSRLVSFLENLALKRASRICSVSADISGKTAKAFPGFRRRLQCEAVPVIHNAIELKSFRPAITHRQQNVLAFAGSLKPIKGIENLLKAYELIARRKVCSLILAGPDTKTATGASYLESCLSKISETARQKIEILGRCPREKVAELFSQATVVVLPSLQEACPLVVMEAMACGAPTVFGACGPHAEIIEDGVDGVICDQHSPEDIADKVLHILESPEYADSLGKAARIKVERDFTEERFLNRTLEFYREVISQCAGHEVSSQ